MGILDYFKRKSTDNSEENKTPEIKREPELYTQEEQEMVETFIHRSFGSFSEVFHEIYSPDIRVDIALIPPSPKREYYKLVTMGMGAHRMTVPEEFRLYGLERAELVMFLPPEWKVKSDEEVWRWPVQCMKTCARWPVTNQAWIGLGQVLRPGQAMHTQTGSNGFHGFLLQHAVTEEGSRPEMELKEGTSVHFYQMIPLYEEEIAVICRSHNPQTILRTFDDADRNYVLNTKRKNYGVPEKEEIRKEG
ncbi:MAG: suppressor of fused domain protein [Fusicatenibacter sp.]|nr:suppressor of fused domain protein [Fusicatenibacter sp.]